VPHCPDQRLCSRHWAVLGVRTVVDFSRLEELPRSLT
jgi:hypothetical protein